MYIQYLDSIYTTEYLQNIYFIYHIQYLHTTYTAEYRHNATLAPHRFTFTPNFKGKILIVDNFDILSLSDRRSR